MSNNQIDAISKYSGSKARFANKVVDVILEFDDGERTIVDICSGSGAITLELRRRGILPQRLAMIEAAHYGGVFKLMSEGRFSRKRMRAELESLPDEPSECQAHLERLASLPVDSNQLLYRFLLLQSVALRALQIEYVDNAWSNAVFDVNRHKKGEGYEDADDFDYVAPNPARIMSRVDKYSKELLGVSVIHGNALDVDYAQFGENPLIYIDPPYENTAGYHYSLNIWQLLERLPAESTVLVSESKALSSRRWKVFERHNRDEFVSQLR